MKRSLLSFLRFCAAYWYAIAFAVFAVRVVWAYPKTFAVFFVSVVVSLSLRWWNDFRHRQIEADTRRVVRALYYNNTQ